MSVDVLRSCPPLRASMPAVGRGPQRRGTLKRETARWKGSAAWSLACTVGQHLGVAPRREPYLPTPRSGMDAFRRANGPERPSPSRKPIDDRGPAGGNGDGGARKGEGSGGVLPGGAGPGRPRPGPTRWPATSPIPRPSLHGDAGPVQHMPPHFWSHPSCRIDLSPEAARRGRRGPPPRVDTPPLGSHDGG